MGFPQDFPTLFIIFATVEALSGILKSKFKRRWLFWFLLLIELICAVIQSVGLIIAAGTGKYSAQEKTAAYTTVVLDAILLILEAFYVYRWVYFMGEMERNKDGNRDHLIASVCIGTFLMISSVPTFIAILRKRSLEPFKLTVHANLLASLPLLTMFILGIWVFLIGIGAVTSDPILIAVFPICYVPVCILAFALGIVILKRDENLSLAFLVISNLFPALLTFKSSIFLTWNFRGSSHFIPGRTSADIVHRLYAGSLAAAQQGMQIRQHHHPYSSPYQSNGADLPHYQFSDHSGSAHYRPPPQAYMPMYSPQPPPMYSVWQESHYQYYMQPRYPPR